MEVAEMNVNARKISKQYENLCFHIQNLRVLPEKKNLASVSQHGHFEGCLFLLISVIKT